MYAAYLAKCGEARVQPFPFERWHDRAALVASIRERVATGAGYQAYAESARQRGLPPSSPETFEALATELAEALEEET